MKAGVLGLVDGTFAAVDSFDDTYTEDDHELQRSLEITRVFSLPSGEMAFAGRGAVETLTEQTTASIERGEIHVTEGARTVTRCAEFVGVPGEFVVVESGDGEFVFDLVAAETGTDIARATLDLDAFFADRDGATPWKAGFAATGGDGVNGVFHGTDLRTNHDVDRLLEDASLNQLGLDYEYDGDEVKMTASRSGYVEVYRPSAFDSARYLEYLRDEVQPYVR
jgi:hypothetical protein